MPTTLGKELIRQNLPRELRDNVGELTKKNIMSLYNKLATDHPNLYRQVSVALQRLGGQAAYESGGYSIGVSDRVRPTAKAGKLREELKAQINNILSDPKMDSSAKNKAIVDVTRSYNEPIEKALYDEALSAKHPIAMQIHSGSKGSKTNLKSMLIGDGLYDDSQYRAIPFPVLRSYSEGLQPHEYMASSFGARLGISLLKLGTADAGYAAKRLNNLSHRLVVTEQDGPHDETTPRGLEKSIDDPDVEGTLLAHPVGNYPRNTILTHKVLSELAHSGVKDLLVRSPAVGGPVDGGLYGNDAGIRDRGDVAGVGEFIGMNAASSLCLAKGTEVRMADGSIKNIEDIKIGDMVLGSDKTGRLKPVSVLNVFDNGIKPIYESVFCRHGYSKKKDINKIKLRSTLDHKILCCNRRWVGADLKKTKLKCGMHYSEIGISRVEKPKPKSLALIAVSPSSFDDSALKTKEPFAMALGLLIGDGCYTGTTSGNGISFTCRDDSLISDTKDYLASLQLKWAKEWTPGHWKMTKLAGIHAGGHNRNPMRVKLMDWGFWGHYSADKVVPSDVHSWSNESVAALMGGLWATDGWIADIRHGEASMGYTSNSIKLINQIRDLLRVRFGIVCANVGATKRKKPDGAFYDTSYDLTISGYNNVRRFHANIKIPGVKQAKLEKLITLINERSKVKAGNHKDNYEPRNFVLIEQTYSGEEQTYDLHVDHPDHLFVLANWLIVSNSEPISQLVMGSKHTGGVSGASKGQQQFPLLNSLISIPENFPGGAVHSQHDGVVHQVAKAPQGGHFIHIGDNVHYAGPDSQVLVKPGDTVEAGDPLTDGIVNPEQIVKHKGIGEGRRQFVKTFRDVAESGGFRPNGRNLEVIARGLIDHVELNKEIGDYVPGDVINYQTLEHQYKPREDAQHLKPSTAIGQYLEKPVLHYTIGTRVTPSVVKNLDKWKVDKIHVHNEEPPFSPVMIRSQETANYDPDWMTRFLGTGLEKTFLKGVHRGDITDPSGTSYVPAVAASTNLGFSGKTKGFVPTPKPATPSPPKFV